MRTSWKTFLRIYFVPAAVFQSVNIGGGYGTGRELVEYFSSSGPWGGLVSILVSTLLMGLVLATGFEFSRKFRLYDYRSFFKALIGRGWWAFEALFLTLVLIALAVVASAAGNVLESLMGIPASIGVILMMVIVGILCFYGREVVQWVMASWSVVLYAVLSVYIILALMQFGPEVANRFSVVEAPAPGWYWRAMQYALYNLPALAVVLFAIREIATRKQAILSGFISAAFFMFPAMLFHLSFMGPHPGILDEPLPVFSILQQMGLPMLVGVYTIVLFGTLIETGAGTIQALIERLDSTLQEQGRPAAPRFIHALIATFGLTLSVVLSKFGIIALVASGYGYLAWGFLVVYVIPLLTVGWIKIWRARGW